MILERSNSRKGEIATKGKTSFQEEPNSDEMHITAPVARMIKVRTL